MSSRSHIVLIMSPVNVQRFMPGLMGFAQSSRDYLQIDIYRPLKEILDLVKEWSPVGVITEFIPGITPRLLKTLRLPTVVAPSDIRGKQVSAVNIDDQAVGKMAANYFFELGLSHFGFYGKTISYSTERQKGYTHCLKQKGHRVHTYNEKETRPLHYHEYWLLSQKKFQAWVDELPKPIGIFAAHDPLGRSLAEQCKKLEIKIPEEVAIVGANNDELICKLINPPMSSISIPWGKIGFEVANLMDQMIGEEGVTQGSVKNKGKREGKHILVQPERVVERQSSNIKYVGDKRLQQVLHFIEYHASEPITVSDCVRQVAVDRRYLEKLFKRHLGRTPAQEIKRVRVEKAKHLLAETDLSMPWVAEKSGFSNAERLSVVFKKWEGMSPSVFRKQYRWVGR